MIGHRKAFSPSLYADTDERAKRQAINLFAKAGMVAVDNPNKYGVDLLLYKDGVKICGIEVEVRRQWKEREFPHADIVVYERKFHYIGTGTMFVCFSNDLSRHFVFNADQIAKAKKVWRMNALSEGKEINALLTKDDVKFDYLYETIKKYELTNSEHGPVSEG